MTLEEYLTDVTKIYFQVTTIIKGRQLLVDGIFDRSPDIRDSAGKLRHIRFSDLLLLPASTKIDNISRDYAIVNSGDTRVVIWPTQSVEEVKPTIKSIILKIVEWLGTVADVITHNLVAPY